MCSLFTRVSQFIFKLYWITTLISQPSHQYQWGENGVTKDLRQDLLHALTRSITINLNFYRNFNEIR